MNGQKKKIFEGSVDIPLNIFKKRYRNMLLKAKQPLHAALEKKETKHTAIEKR